MMNNSQTHCPKGHEFTESNTRWVFRPKSGKMGRRCKKCAHMVEKKRLSNKTETVIAYRDRRKAWRVKYTKDNPKMFQDKRQRYEGRVWGWMNLKKLAIRTRKKKFENNIDTKFLVDLCEKQNYKCAISNLNFTFMRNDPYSASIDRIDSSKGYLEENVQIVCTFINLAKNKHSNNQILEIIEKLREQGRQEVKSGRKV